MSATLPFMPKTDQSIPETLCVYGVNLFLIVLSTQVHGNMAADHDSGEFVHTMAALHCGNARDAVTWAVCAHLLHET